MSVWVVVLVLQRNFFLWQLGSFAISCEFWSLAAPPLDRDDDGTGRRKKELEFNAQGINSRSGFGEMGRNKRAKWKKGRKWRVGVKEPKVQLNIMMMAR